MTLLREAAALYLPQIMEFMRKCASMRAIIIGDRFYEQNVIAMMKGGVRGFLLREHLDADIIKCIHTIARGEIWLTGDLVTRVCDKKYLLKAPQQSIGQNESHFTAGNGGHGTCQRKHDQRRNCPKTFPERQDRQDAYPQNIFEKTDIRNRVEAALLYIRYKQSVKSRSGPLDII